MPLSAHRGEILHFLDDPAASGESAWQYFEDGTLVLEDGHVQSIGESANVLGELAETVKVHHHQHGLITPGFVDTHIHFPQCEVIAAYGTRLLDWLQAHTFPAESQFGDPQYAAGVAQFFLDQLLDNGTTTALVFGTVHPESVDAFFSAAQARRLRMVAGKVMMDRNAPGQLLDTPASAYADSKALLQKWHGQERLGYAITPRFAPTSSEQQLAAAGKLLSEFPDAHFHTHLSENEEECNWVAELFADSKNYLDVYDRHNLLGKRSIFAHGIHLSDDEWKRLADSGSGIAHCPLSNLFIGSGLFRYAEAQEHGVNVGLGSDIGGGDSFSILRVINEAYKVQQLLGNNLSPFQSLYLATLGGARTLDLDRHIGNFETGKEADFVVLDYKATALIDYRIGHCSSLQEKLFVMEMLGDDRAVRETWIMGEQVSPTAAAKKPD